MVGGYLFAHFAGEGADGEQVYFAVSRDGLHWRDLNGGKPALRSALGTGGVRDPFLVRHPSSGKVYLMATDLCIRSNPDWSAAQTQGSRDMILWETGDLIHWDGPWAHTAGLPEAGCVWAPEAVYDREMSAFLVFFASKVKGKHRIYAVYTEDFKRFSEPFLYIEKERDIIDTTILEHEGRYYRVSKNEASKRLILEVSSKLMGTYTQIPSNTLEALEFVEGPEGYLLPDGKTWCLMADRFMTGQGYVPMVSDDLSSGQFRVLHPEEYDMGTVLKKHGGVLSITESEYQRLLTDYGE